MAVARKKRKRDLHYGRTYVPTTTAGAYLLDDPLEKITPPPNVKVTRRKSGRRKRPDPMRDYIEGPDVEWWLAHSEHSAASINKQYEKQEVAIVLLERTGAIISRDPPTQKGESTKRDVHYLAIQIVRHDGDIDVSLEDIGVFLDEVWTQGVRENE